jgi:hypothetical protein
MAEIRHFRHSFDTLVTGSFPSSAGISVTSSLLYYNNIYI